MVGAERALTTVSRIRLVHRIGVLRILLYGAAHAGGDFIYVACASTLHSLTTAEVSAPLV